MPNVLFVCTANRCRSPMAERLFIRLLKQSNEEEAKKWTVSSTGTWAQNGIPPDENVIKTMADFDIDIWDHRSRAIDKALISEQDLLLVMEQNHLEALKFEFPHKAASVFLLSQMVGQSFDIEDPFSRSLKAYQRAAHQINEILEQGFTKICSLAYGSKTSHLASQA